MNSSTDITSQQDQNIRQHSHSEISKENVCQHTETVWVPGENMASKWLKRQRLHLRFHQAVRFRWTMHDPSVLQHLGIHTHHLRCHCCLQYIYWLFLFLVSPHHSLSGPNCCSFNGLFHRRCYPAYKNTCNKADFSEHHASVDWCGLLHSLILNIAQAVM